jgi:hypothetical protein
MIWRLHAEGFEQVGSPGWQPDRCCEWAAPIDHDGDGVLALGAITKDHGGARTWEIDGAPDLDLVPDHVSGGGLYVATTVPAATFLDLPRLSIIAGDCLVYEICPPDPG